MSKTVSTKIGIPRPTSSIVLRPRLMQLYDEGLQRQLTLVSAPAGYGKTTSTILWLRALGDRLAPGAGNTQPIRQAWYSLDREDNDISTFFTRLVAAIEAAIPGTRLSVATGLAVQSIPTEQYANALAEACLELPTRIILVLDDYHLIALPAIHETLYHLIRYASSKLHLVVTTRHDPPLRLMRLRAENQVTEIRTAHLLLTEDEVSEFLKLRLAQRPQASLVTELHERTEGWLAGLQLAAVAIDGYGGQHAFAGELRRGDSRYVMDYLFDEVLDHEPGRIKEFLLKTALLDRFSVELAAHITQFPVSECGAILDDLRRQNLFIVALDTENTWVRYHRQFQAMLVNRAQVTFTHAAIASLRSEAAAWLIARDRIDEAFAEFVAAREWDKAAELAALDCHRLQNRDQWHLLWRRIAQIPDGVVAERPDLLLAQAWIMQVNDRGMAIPPLVARAEALLRADPADVDTSGTLWGEIYALRGSWIFPELSPAERTEYLHAALHRLPEPEYAWIRGFVYIQLAHLLVGQGEADAARHQIRSEIDAHGVGAGSYLTRLHHALAVVAYLDGPLAELQQVAEHYLQLAKRHDMAMAAGWARYALGWANLQRSQPALAWDVTLPIFDDPHTAHLQVTYLALSVLVPAGARTGNLDQVEGLLDQSRHIAVARENTSTGAELAALRAYGALLRGDRGTALAWADDFRQTYQRMSLAQRRGPVLSMQLLVYSKAVLAWGDALRIGDAIEPMRSYIQSVQARGSQLHVIQGAILLACCYWRTGQERQAQTWMQTAVEVGFPRGFRWAFFEQAEDLPAILYALVKNNDKATAAARLLAEFQAWSAENSAPHPAGSEAILEPLTEREVDILDLMAQKLSNKEIAHKLDISPFTVRNHTSNIYAKLNVATRRQAVAQAQTLGLLPAHAPRYPRTRPANRPTTAN